LRWENDLGLPVGPIALLRKPGGRWRCHRSRDQSDEISPRGRGHGARKEYRQLPEAGNDKGMNSPQEVVLRMQLCQHPDFSSQIHFRLMTSNTVR
jgi:hypothetical protein